MEQPSTFDEFAPIIEQIEQLPCRCCLQKTLHAHVQRGFRIANDGVYVDCRNPGCALYYVTHRFNEWIAFDVSVWGAQEDPAWQPALVEVATASASLRALVESHIREHDAPLADLVLRDFREQLASTLPYRRRSLCESWLHLYTVRAS